MGIVAYLDEIVEMDVELVVEAAELVVVVVVEEFESEVVEVAEVVEFPLLFESHCSLSIGAKDWASH